MHISFIGVRSYPSTTSGVSGIEVRIENIVSLLKHNHKISIYTRKWLNPKKKVEKNLTIIPIKSPYHKYLDTLIYSCIASLKASFSVTDIIFFESSTSSFFCFLPKFFGKKIVVTIHTREWERKKWNFIVSNIINFVEWYSVKMADKVVTVSEELQNYIHKKYKRSSVLIPYFLQKEAKRKPWFIKKKYNLSGNDYILFLGRFTPEKRIEWLIKAYLKIKPNLKLVLAGNSLYEKKYTQHINNLVNGNKNIILTGNVFDQEKKELLANCVLFVLPSEIEGYPIALCEAISYGTCFLVGELKDIQKNIGNMHLFFKTKSYHNFFSKLNWLLTNNNYKQIDVSIGNTFITQQEFVQKYEAVISDIQNQKTE